MKIAAQHLATKEQIIALQTLYSRWEKHTLQGEADPRSARLAWASEMLSRQISSFSKLTGDEAARLIDVLKGSMGQPIGQSPNPWRHIRSRESASLAGRSGRKGHPSKVVQIASRDDLARIEQTLSRLGWTQDRFEAWLTSGRSPLGQTDSPTIRTVAEANRIWWALKAMLRRSGRWHGRKSSDDPERLLKSISNSNAQTSDSDADLGLADARGGHAITSAGDYTSVPLKPQTVGTGKN